MFFVVGNNGQEIEDFIARVVVLRIIQVDKAKNEKKKKKIFLFFLNKK